MSLDIEIKNARVYFPVKSGYVRAVDGISATFKEGEITGIIGESGCGKSVLGMYLLGMLPDYAVIVRNMVQIDLCPCSFDKGVHPDWFLRFLFYSLINMYYMPLSHFRQP